MSATPGLTPQPLPADASEAQVQAWLQQALLLQQQGQIDQARAVYGQILECQPDNFDALQLLGAVELGRGDLARAAELLRHAIRKLPGHAGVHYNLGVVLTALGQAEAAADSYLQAAVLQPDFADAHYCAATTLSGLKRHQAAMASHDRAVALRPEHAAAWNNRGNALAALGQHQAALDSYRRAIAADAGFADAWNNQGNVLRELRRKPEALASYEQAIALQPALVEPHANRGLMLHELGQYAQALQSHQRVLALQPDQADAHFNCGNAFSAMKQYQAAVDSFDRALTLRPDHAVAWFNRGVALGFLKRREEALTSYDTSLTLRPAHPPAWNNRGLVLRELGRPRAALESFDAALAIQPDNAQALNNRGLALRDLLEHQAALACFERAITLQNDYPEAHNNRGVALTDLGRHALAPASYRRAVALRPDYAEAHWNLALCELQMGHFEPGWAGYEWRWKREELAAGSLRPFTQPLWLGRQPLAGQTMLLHAEQGLGDTLQFCRYAALVEARGARVILEVQKPLVRLLQGLDGVAQVVARGSALPPFDLHCPLLSLPLAFGTTLADMPPPARLAADPDKRARWAARLGARRGSRIGLAWSGSTTHDNDINRSIALADLLRHLPAGPQYVSLQKEVRAADRAALEARPDILHVGEDLEDFTDTAALCELMDGVVSVDTSVAHLAGTLGRRLWLLLPFNPDWRWMLERTDSPWYPGARLCRQPAIGDWDSVLSSLGREIGKIQA